jgi:hypothetical protein
MLPGALVRGLGPTRSDGFQAITHHGGLREQDSRVDKCFGLAFSIIVTRTKMTVLPSVLVTIFVGLLVLILRSTIKTCVEDARRRGKSPLLVTVAVILFFLGAQSHGYCSGPNP